MSSRPLILLVASLSVATGFGASAQAARRPAPRPDLSTSAGTAKLLAGVVSGTATIKDARAAAGRTSATLLAKNLGTGKTTTIRSFSVPRLARGASRRIKLGQAKVPTLSAGTYAIRLCADGRGVIKERTEANNCVTIGRLTVPGTAGTTPTTPATAAPGPTTTPPTGPSATPATPAPPAPTTTPTQPPTQPPAASGFVPPPQHPIAPLTADADGSQVNGDNEAAAGTYAPYAVSHGTTASSDYWLKVPASYDDTHTTPERLLVWLHGCGGDAEGDVYEASPDLTGPDDRPYVTLSLGGTDGGCWDPVDQREDWVLAAINDVEKHLNIDRRRVIIGGYSSGGDLGYRTIFDHADWFAGAMVENSAPFAQNGASDDHAAWKFPVDHLAHASDSTYPFASQVQPGFDKMLADGWAAASINVTKLAGFHANEEYATSDDPDCIRVGVAAHPECTTQYDPDQATTGIDHDLRHTLLPLLTKTAAQKAGGAAGWQAPVSPATTAG